jgi:phosphoglycolate phosphatase-like HAD superfamily hydrolase
MIIGFRRAFALQVRASCPRVGAVRWHGDCNDHMTLCVELDALLSADRKSILQGYASTLQALKDEHHNIVFVSSATKSDTESFLKAAGLHDIKSCCRDSLPVFVPNPGVLIYAIETLAGGEMSNSLSIGSSMDNLKMAKGAGVPVMHIKQHERLEWGANPLSATADIRVDSFEDVPSGIQRLKDSSMY